MNNDRRKAIKAITALLERAEALVEQAKEEIQDVIAAEQEALDSLPESFQDGERGQAMQAAIDNLEAAHDDLDCWTFSSVTLALEDAQA